MLLIKETRANIFSIIYGIGIVVAIFGYFVSYLLVERRVWLPSYRTLGSLILLTTTSLPFLSRPK